MPRPRPICHSTLVSKQILPLLIISANFLNLRVLKITCEPINTSSFLPTSKLPQTRMVVVPITSLLGSIASVGDAYNQGEPGSRESLIELSRQLIGALEIPSEFLQRSFWAEVCASHVWPITTNRRPRKLSLPCRSPTPILPSKLIIVP